ncbi:hypothetical protein H6G20_00580 [Desertifilum sp. FACHB-1129]|uniref:Uncharacterized protein n=2 Tax=Desertifilum tharense IPPAS B-1220 TaxID=1781255 RepID=A0A1E5QKQ1_9CYAN|nr:MULTISPECIES: hypothetical protein [Desertifilum]MDA0210229.1 hypothetical protein [Cyanobacteria bacterium FC1]MDI9639742.1 hypothetical protein [Geitlerinema splendidum]MBD2310175.1 hypothetical protein [Desertifilum sp. FACHB-1129]MBD2322551.1 hypothetical protein [Desertifilum sp. FACHB-866]MBD2334604.1 hypothetical protein [Desertifilum sp. FACHB-868]
MSDFSPERWQKIKQSASRLQVLKTLLDFFEQTLNHNPNVQDLKAVEQQLQNDFDQTLENLINLIEEDDDL